VFLFGCGCFLLFLFAGVIKVPRFFAIIAPPQEHVLDRLQREKKREEKFVGWDLPATTVFVATESDPVRLLHLYEVAQMFCRVERHIRHGSVDQILNNDKLRLADPGEWLRIKFDVRPVVIQFRKYEIQGTGRRALYGRLPCRLRKCLIESAPICGPSLILMRCHHTCQYACRGMSLYPFVLPWWISSSYV